MAFGVSLSVKSNLGVSPVNSVPYVVSLISGFDQGLCVTIIFIFFIVLQFLILKKEFEIKNLLQILCASLFGYFVSFSNNILSFKIIDIYIIKCIYMLLGTVLLGIGIFLYLMVDLIPLPTEGIMLALKRKTSFEFHNIKIGFDILTVIIAVGLSYLFFKKIYGVREGTVIAAFLVGKVVGLVPKLFGKYVEKLKKIIS